MFGSRQAQTRTAENAQVRAQLEVEELTRLIDEMQEPLIDLRRRTATTPKVPIKRRATMLNPLLPVRIRQNGLPGWTNQPSTSAMSIVASLSQTPTRRWRHVLRSLQQDKLREALNERLDELAPNRYRPDLET